MFGALVYFMLRDIPYVDKAQAARDAEWRRAAPTPSLNFQQIVRVSRP